MPKRTSKWLEPALWATLSFYLIARLCQLIANQLPTLLVVCLHVMPPAVFALLHGARVYGIRGMARFTAICLGVATIAESLSLRTGFPYGHYYFTGVMGPKLFDLPFLLVMAYLGIGYASWTIATLILRTTRLPVAGVRLITLPLLAALVMTAWDLSMDADWSTLDRAWIWRDGGALFGVPLSNYFGWMLTAFIFYLLFALTSRTQPPTTSVSPAFRRMPVLLYALCATGNLLIFFLPMAPPIVADPAGHLWHTTAALRFTAAISVLVMLPLALLAWRASAATPLPTDSPEILKPEHQICD